MLEAIITPHNILIVMFVENLILAVIVAGILGRRLRSATSKKKH